MAMSQNGHLIRSSVVRGIRVVRFTRPDLREHLEGDVDDCTLFRELHDRALAGLAKGQTLVLNFGLIEPFSTAFYSCLLKVREVVLARKARLFLCRLSSEHLEIFELFRAARLFDIVNTEAQALRNAGGRRGVLDTW
jgi:anti-anti-sigma regulatory factor